ncbi:hypothetical protein L1887_32186 [Cichorium endivia]|nr:hypothetical protein L1887_32186 [Cichorium endivia]
MVLYDPEVVSAMEVLPSPTQGVIVDNQIEPNNEATGIQDDTIPVVIEDVDIDVLVTEPVDTGQLTWMVLRQIW